MNRLLFCRSNCSNIAGYYPPYTGNSTITKGTPLGKHLITSMPVHGDPIAWYPNLMSNPSLFVLGRPGLGKSSLIIRMILGIIARGDIAVIMGDLKGEYINLTNYVGGKVIDFSKGVDILSTVHNSLPSVREEVLSKLINLLITLLSIYRRKMLTDVEISILEEVIRLLVSNKKAKLFDILALIDNPTEELLQITLSKNSEEYKFNIKGLRLSLQAFIYKVKHLLSGNYKLSFEEYSAFCINISSIREDDDILTSMIMLSSWHLSTTYILNMQKKIPNKWYCAIFDELWRPLRTAGGMVDRIDALTRLNRHWGIAQILITHTLKDVLSLDKVTDVAKASGFIERVGSVICAGLPQTELEVLGKVVLYSQREIKMISRWTTPSVWHEDEKQSISPGRGKFMLKIGDRLGIPFELILTDKELEMHNTDKWLV